MISPTKLIKSSFAPKAFMNSASRKRFLKSTFKESTKEQAPQIPVYKITPVKPEISWWNRAVRYFMSYLGDYQPELNYAS